MAQKKNIPTTKSRKSWVAILLLILLSLMIIILYKAAFVMLLLAMMPTIIASYADTSSDKTRVATIALCNLSGVTPYFIPFAQAGGKWEQLGYRLSDYNMWLVVYGMAACGYGLIKFCPAIYHGFLKINYASKIMQAQHKQDELLREWGEDIAVLATK